MTSEFDIIHTARITEKATSLGAFNQYVLEVDCKATKQEIKQAVKSAFGKTALRVNTIRVKGKAKRSLRTGHQGRQGDYKKAIVTLKQGEKLEFV